MKIKTSDLTLLALNNAVHELVYPDEPIKEGCTAPPYSTDWSFGGPIIEREKIRLNCGDGTWGVAEGVWEAAHPRNIYVSFGPTPLVAAMRCYVASEPEELL
jgi:hypothetical protein